MNNYYVFVGADGYIQGYSLVKQPNTIQVQAKKEEIETHFLAMKIKNGIAVMDLDKQKEIEEQWNQPTDIQVLQQQNANLAMIITHSSQLMTQLQQQNADLTLVQTELQAEIKEIKGGGQ